MSAEGRVREGWKGVGYGGEQSYRYSVRYSKQSLRCATLMCEEENNVTELFYGYIEFNSIHTLTKLLKIWNSNKYILP